MNLGNNWFEQKEMGSKHYLKVHCRSPSLLSELVLILCPNFLDKQVDCKDMAVVEHPLPRHAMPHAQTTVQ
jgi:hypothetical protein